LEGLQGLIGRVVPQGYSAADGTETIAIFAISVAGKEKMEAEPRRRIEEDWLLMLEVPFETGERLPTRVEPHP
jgi:hypothetical protein